MTNIDGQFTFETDGNGILVFSFVGYERQEVPINNQSTINVSMVVDAEQLEEVVVTALGVERSSKGLTYSTQSIGSEELTKVKDPNLMNSLSGKVAGVNISRAASGAGGSVKVTLRGNTSANGSNQPLYVIDGIPMTNFTTELANDTWGGRDAGDGISNLNPDDIESINVLKGAAASALYGSQAANGVIMITTKKGQAGVSKVTFSSSFTADQAYKLPELQNDYSGLDVDGNYGEKSWGEKGKGTAFADANDFLEGGSTFINSISATHGSDNSQIYFSYANTDAKGTMPTNTLSKHNFTVRQSSKLFDGKLELDANINYMNQKVNNRPVFGLYNNPYQSYLIFPRGVDINQYKNGYEVFDEKRKIPTQQWHALRDINQNPWWLINRVQSEEVRNRLIASVSGKYNINDWMWAQARLNLDQTDDAFEKKYHATTQATHAAENGRYQYVDVNNTQIYADAIFNMTKKFGDINLNALIGTSIRNTVSKGQVLDTGTGGKGLLIPNYFTVDNIHPSSTVRPASVYTHKQLQSFFASAQVSYKDFLFLDVTGRNDWSSALQESFFYPSVGLTAVLNEVLNMPSAIEMAKVRASYTQVGNDVPAYVTNPGSRVINGALQYNTRQPIQDLKAELSSSLEFGIELDYKGKVYLDLSYYKTNTTNQYFEIAASPSSGYSTALVNGGNIENRGVEAMLTLVPVSTGDLTWSTTFNFSTNKNEVIELHDEVPEFILTAGGVNNYVSKISVGGSYGDIYSTKMKRDENGNVILSDAGIPVPTDERVLVGNANPDWQLGWNNTVTYKSFAFSFLIDGKFGGEVMSMTQSILDEYGVSKTTGDARNAGGVDVGSGIVPADQYFATVSGRASMLGEYMYDATNIRLREVSLSYTLPTDLAFFKNVSVSVIARNLFFFSLDAPYDPEVTMSPGNGLQGIDIFGMPTTRSIGGNVRFSF